MKTTFETGRRIFLWLSVASVLACSKNPVEDATPGLPEEPLTEEAPGTEKPPEEKAPGTKVGLPPPWSDSVEGGEIVASWGTNAIASGIEAYDKEKHKNPVMVIVLDTGVGKHESLTASMPNETHWLNVKKDEPKYTVGCNPHATHVAGIIGGKGTAFRGVFPGVPITSVNFQTNFSQEQNCATGSPLSPDTVAETLESIYNFIANKYKGPKVSVVINFSASSAADGWAGGPNFFVDMEEGKVGYWFKKIATPAGEYPGAVVVLAAGNASKNACITTYSDFATASAHPSDGILVAGALDRNGQPVMKDGFWTKESNTPDALPDSNSGAGSNYGRCVDLWAPGHEIYSSWGDRENLQSLGDGNKLSNVHRMKSGTSMAAPHIAGLAAYLIATSEEATLTPADVEAKIRALATNLGSKVNAEAGDSQSWCPHGPCEVMVPSYPKLRAGAKAHPSVLFKFLPITSFDREAATALNRTLPQELHWKLAYESSGATHCWLEASHEGVPLVGFPGPSADNTRFYTWNFNPYALDPGLHEGKVTCSDGGRPEALVAATAKIQITQAEIANCSFFYSINDESALSYVDMGNIRIPYEGGKLSVTANCPAGFNTNDYRWSANGGGMARLPVPDFDGKTTVSHIFDDYKTNIAVWGTPQWELGFRPHSSYKESVITIIQMDGTGPQP